MGKQEESKLAKEMAIRDAAIENIKEMIANAQKEKIVEVNKLIIEYEIRHTQLSNKAKLFLASRKRTKTAAKKASKKSGKKRVSVSKQATANTSA